MRALLIDQYTNSLPWVNIDHFRCLLIVFSGTSESYSELRHLGPESWALYWLFLRSSWLIARFTRRVIRLGNHCQPYFRSLPLVRWSAYRNTILSYHIIESNSRSMSSGIISSLFFWKIWMTWMPLAPGPAPCLVSTLYRTLVSWMRGIARNWRERRPGYACWYNCTCQRPPLAKITLATCQWRWSFLYWREYKCDSDIVNSHCDARA